MKVKAPATPTLKPFVNMSACTRRRPSGNTSSPTTTWDKVAGSRSQVAGWKSPVGAAGRGIFRGPQRLPAWHPSASFTASGSSSSCCCCSGGVSHSHRGGPKSITSNRWEQAAKRILHWWESGGGGGSTADTPRYHHHRHHHVCLHGQLSVYLPARHRLGDTDFGDKGRWRG